MTTFSPSTHEDVRAAVETLLGALSGAVGGWTAGSDVPRDVAVLDPIVGSWGWSAPLGAWFSQPYVVSWAAGAVGGTPPTFADNTQLTIGSDLTAPAIAVFSPPANGPTWTYGSSGGVPSVTPNAAAGSGTGVAFFVSFGGSPDAPPHPELNAADYLGDITLTNGTTPAVWPTDEGIGVDGQFYLQTYNNNVYGPRTAGTWGDPVGVLGYPGVPVYDPGYITIRSATGSTFVLTVADDGTLSTVPA